MKCVNCGTNADLFSNGLCEVCFAESEGILDDRKYNNDNVMCPYCNATNEKSNIRCRNCEKELRNGKFELKRCK